MINLFGRIDGNDILILFGLILLSYGLYLIWLPLIPVVDGFLLLVMGLIGAYRKGQNR
jgi:hypothetical protein